MYRWWYWKISAILTIFCSKYMELQSQVTNRLICTPGIPTYYSVNFYLFSISAQQIESNRLGKSYNQVATTITLSTRTLSSIRDDNIQ